MRKALHQFAAGLQSTPNKPIRYSFRLARRRRPIALAQLELHIDRIEPSSELPPDRTHLSNMLKTHFGMQRYRCGFTPADDSHHLTEPAGY